MGMNMDSKRKTVTMSWRRKDTGEWSRLAVSRKTIAFLSALSLVSFLASLLFGISWVSQRKELEAFLKKYSAQTIRLQRAEAKIQDVKDDLSRLRSEETKIRSWLGIGDQEPSSSGDQGDAVEDAPGGKGNLEDVTIGAVAPSDRIPSLLLGMPVNRDDVKLEAVQLLADLRELSELAQERRKEWDAIPAISPVDGEYWISSSFGWRKSPFTGKREFHAGMDMAGQKGTPIVAAADGRVTKVVRDAAMGPSITVRHKDGVETIYGHLSEVLVKRGKIVSRGEQIGAMGNLGKRSTGPHLHYAVRVNGKYVNPWNYMLDQGRSPYTVAKNNL